MNADTTPAAGQARSGKSAYLGIEPRPLLGSGGRPYRSLVDPVLFQRLVGRVIKDEQYEQALAERIVDAAIGFVYLCGTNPAAGFAPSKLVDIGWHTFILYTKHYAAFCARYAARGFVHHEPTDAPGVKHEGNGPLLTMQFMVRHSIPFDRELWDVAMGYDSQSNCCAKCSECTTNGWCNGTG